MRLALVRVDVTLAGPVQLDYPLHLDGLLTEAAYRRLPHGDIVDRSSPPPRPLDIPVGRARARGQWVWCASALVLHDPRPHVASFTRRRDPADIDRLVLPWTPGSGPGRDRLVHEVAWVASRGHWLAWGSPRETRKALGLVWPGGRGHLGDRRRHGLGEVTSCAVSVVEDGRPLDAVVHAGRTARHLPLDWMSTLDPAHVRDAAVLPPYWHPARQGPCVTVGAMASLHDDVLAALAAPETW